MHTIVFENILRNFEECTQTGFFIAIPNDRHVFYGLIDLKSGFNSCRFYFVAENLDRDSSYSSLILYEPNEDWNMLFTTTRIEHADGFERTLTDRDGSDLDLSDEAVEAILRLEVIIKSCLKQYILGTMKENPNAPFYFGLFSIESLNDIATRLNAESSEVMICQMQLLFEPTMSH